MSPHLTRPLIPQRARTHTVPDPQSSDKTEVPQPQDEQMQLDEEANEANVVRVPCMWAFPCFLVPLRGGRLCVSLRRFVGPQ